MRRALVLCALSVAVAASLGCGGADSTSETTTETTTSEETTSSPGSATCADVEAPAPREDGGATAPSERLDPERTYTLTFTTSCGTFAVTLDQGSAPETAASLVALAREGFFDETVFHRIVPGFVIQGGDPTQSGSGGPGYSTVDPPPADATYGKGVVAMAKTGAEAAGTSGSQFFVVTAEDAGLPPDYAIVGSVADGLDVVLAIDAQGDPATELPLRPIVVDTVTVDESG